MYRPGMISEAARALPSDTIAAAATERTRNVAARKDILRLIESSTYTAARRLVNACDDEEK